MNKKFFILLTAMLLTFASASLADDGLGSLVNAAPSVTADPSQTQAEAALLAELPTAVIHFALQERDDGRMEWNIFFTNGTDIGQAEVDAETFVVRKLKTYAMPEDTLTAGQAVASLKAAKGELILRDLELDRDDGQLWYEGECELNGKKYDFEMTTGGKVVEWERD